MNYPVHGKDSARMRYLPEFMTAQQNALAHNEQARASKRPVAANLVWSGWLAVAENERIAKLIFGGQVPDGDLKEFFGSTADVGTGLVGCTVVGQSYGVQARGRYSITHIFDKPRRRPKYIEPLPPEECERLRQKCQLFGPDTTDQWTLYCLDQAGQLVINNLYDLGDTEPITAFTEKETTRLLEYMVWDHSHKEDYITEAQVDGKRQRATWKSEISTPTLKTHLAGERYFGVKKGRMTMQIATDLDRHGGEVPGEHHVIKALVASRPSRSPAFARSKAPVQMERTNSASWERALIQSVSAGLCISLRVP
jgi:hypothetical protein